MAAPAAFITLQVPPSAAPGTPVQFADPNTGQTLQVNVPQGAAPGSTFQVQLAAPEMRSTSDVEQAVAGAKVAGAVASKAVDLGVKATVAVGRATFAAGKYAHDKGWDAKAAKAGGAVAKATGKAMLAGGKMAFKAATSSSAPAPAPAASGGPSMPVAFGDGGAAAQPAPPPPQEGVMWVIVPPDAAPGTQILVLAPSGQQFAVVVPDGAMPGTQFAVQLG